MRISIYVLAVAIVLSHFNLGVIESIQTFPRGSRRAPKVVIRSDTKTALTTGPRQEI